MAELFLFRDGVSTFGFSPTILNKTLNGITYEAAPIKRTAINLTDNFAKIPVTIDFPISNTFALSLVRSTPEQPISLIIYDDGVIFWKGQVKNAVISSAVIKVSCASIITSTARKGLHNKYTLTCRHTLYSTNCGVDKEGFSESFTSVTASSKEITIANLSDPSGTYDRGIAEMAGQRRHIIKQVGSVITLPYPFTGNLTGTIKLSLGCDLTEANCISFSNLDNFGGSSRIPSKNPFKATGLL